MANPKFYPEPLKSLFIRDETVYVQNLIEVSELSYRICKNIA